jgi:3-hydroxyacyl-CoA dehydrogenase/enoyl-CoA hydratase/3-hydroxybutyryl-CoA epimerase
MAGFETNNLRVEPGSSGQFSMLLLDVAGKSVNVFNREVLADLEAALDHLKNDGSLKLLGIKSAKPSKPIAGADLNEFTKVSSPSEAKALSALGQRVFGKLADLPATTLIVVQGPCLGGGLEFAMACDYRLVIDHPKTQLGLPEVELGLIPGWGGTQRLPRRIGLERALQVILGGRRLSAREALRWGLADSLAHGEADMADALRKLGDIAVKRGKQPCGKLPKRNWRQRLLESNPIGRNLILRGAERIMQRKVPDDFPGPAEALAAVRIGLAKGMQAGLAYEQEAGARLMSTTACRNMINIFFQREQARKAPKDESIPKVRRVGIVGAGTMGAGIAQLAALRGFEVVVQEVDQAALAAGMNKIADLVDKAVERGVLSRAEADEKLAGLGRTTSWEGFGEVDLVVEAVLEDLPLKQKVFRELENRCRPEAVLATNTSSLVVAEIQTVLRHPERIAGLHFFNPVHKMPLVEVVRAPATDQTTLERARQWASDLGKTPVIVKDSPGFVVNRILMPYLDEAARLVTEGMAIERVDQTMRRFGMPMGPLELLDQIGLDVAAHVARSMPEEVSKRFPPNPVFQKMFERGWLGQKSGIGFYLYEGKKQRPHAAILPILREQSKELLGSLPPATQLREARERMVLLMLNEAAACLDERLADADTIDLAMVFGTGWAPHRGGPLHYLKERGEAAVAKSLRSFVARLGPRFEPCPALMKSLNSSAA